jgi:hypothetical protein
MQPFAKNRLLGRARCIFMAIVACSACATQEVVLLDLPTGAATSAGPAGKPCVDNRDCPLSFFCGKDSCGAMLGRCDPLPLLCDADLGPSCGCDGVTYWNDCLRRLAGSAAGTKGECSQAAALCGGMDARACPKGAICTRVSPVGVCDPMEPGRCWGLPANCPAEIAVRAQSCAPERGCVDLCSALKSAAPHTLAPACSP